eukprot:TRINITY_DN3914_c0_g1_i1.p1 TRINITY_DN3914_c0_g1~~TRINITY_DN3914_c0_g1_i1.p1  ORF type:complete len:955 (+),score=220.17 TRINITY_DN3914_c0_g1_i1:155-3019(+)
MGTADGVAAEQEAMPERRGYLLNEYTGAREYFVLRGCVLRIRQAPKGCDTGSVYLSFGSQVNLLANNVLELRSAVPYDQEYILAAMSEHDAEGWYDAIRDSIRVGQARLRKLTSLLENGCTMHKYNYSNSKRSRRYFWVSDEGKELCWGRSKGVDTQKVYLKECIGIIYGPMTTTFQRCTQLDDPSWTCFSLLFMGRTLDLAVAGDLQVHAWFLGMQHLISRHGVGSMPMMSDAQFVARKVQYKLMDAAHRNDLVLGRYLLQQVKALAAGKGLTGLGRGALVSGGRLAAPLLLSGNSASGQATVRADAKTSRGASSTDSAAEDRLTALRSRLLTLQATVRDRAVQAQVAESILKRAGKTPHTAEELSQKICNDGLSVLRARCSTLEQETSQLTDAAEQMGAHVKAAEKIDRSVRKIQSKLDESETRRMALEGDLSTVVKKTEASSGARARASTESYEVHSRVESLQKQAEELEKRMQKVQRQQDAEAELKNKQQDEAIAAAEQARLKMAEKVEAMQRENGRLQDAEQKTRLKLEKMQAVSAKLDKAVAPLRKAASKLHEEQRRARSEIQESSRTFGTEIQNVVGAVAKIGENSKSIEEKYHDAMEDRKKLHNLVLDLKGNIRVFVRVRPINKKEADLEPSGEATISFTDGLKMGVYDGQHSRRKWFEFDHVFNTTSTQVSVFEEAKALVTSVLDGYNVCVFAYGQTGSGKTHTMTGYDGDAGLNTRVLQELFRLRTERSDGYAINISISITEIYNETIRDLLMPSTKKLDAKINNDGSVTVPGLHEEKVGSCAEVLKCIENASKNRATSTTDMNEHSSRSHSIVTVRTQCTVKATGDAYIGKVHLVDLAGSENVGKSGVSGQGMKEAQNINKSLSALGDVIQSLVAKAPHTPYRNSKLTMLLKDSLGGDSKTLMIVCSSPAQTNVTETLSSLNFASRARNVELGKAKRNVSSSN